eukprot:scaffold6137_cov35-Phaeocystis_antarctica.AAC.1
MPSASCPSPACAIAAASVAAPAGRCGASRWPFLAVAIAIAICLFSGALQRPLPSTAAAVVAAAAVTAAALASAAAPLLCPTVCRRPVSMYPWPKRRASGDSSSWLAAACRALAKPVRPRF